MVEFCSKGQIYFLILLSEMIWNASYDSISHKHGRVLFEGIDILKNSHVLTGIVLSDSSLMRIVLD